MSTQSSQADLIYVFGLFRLDPKESVLLRDGVPIPLSPKAFDVLVHLLGNHGHLVDKDDLLQSVWPDSIVEEGNLNLAVHQARKALGDDPGKPTYIQTVPKRGYRFIADVTAVSLSDLVLTKPEPSQTDVPSQPPGSPVGDPSASSKLPSRRRFLTTPSLRAVAVGFVTGLVLAFVIILEAGALRDKSTVHGNVVGAGSDRLQANAPFDEVEVKRVVKESQLAETLTIYTHPNAFD
ncbi:MAG: winged helix-turn-helix domain-containing protein, partial [Blastocatellia bacterium]